MFLYARHLNFEIMSYLYILSLPRFMVRLANSQQHCS